MGKLLGGFFGLLIAGPFGLMLGIILGHYFDSGLLHSIKHSPFNTQNILKSQQAFFKITFQVMGHIAKSDGRVSESEIRVARQTMDHLGLSVEQRKKAVDFFNEGKQPEFELMAMLKELKQHCHFKSVLQLFVDIQVRAAYAEGMPQENKRRLILSICRTLGVQPPFFQQYQHSHGHQREAYQKQTKDTIAEAYAILGVEANVNDSELKRAYRRLMNKNHPDKLIANGLPEEMIKAATEKTQEIQKAYELLRELRGFT